MFSPFHHHTQAKMLPDAYGCVVANRFGNLLDDEADPFDLINKVETEKEKKKKKKKQNDDKNVKQKKTGQKESQKDRRVPITSDAVDSAPGKARQLGRSIATHPTSTSFWQLRLFLDWIVLPKVASLLGLCQLLMVQGQRGCSPCACCQGGFPGCCVVSLHAMGYLKPNNCIAL